MIPTREQCLAILNKHEVPDNIISHSKIVADISLKIAEMLIEKGHKVNLKLVEAGALLHDIDKMATIQGGKHGEESARILSD